MPDRILKTVVIGLGRIAWSDHLPFLQKDSRFELTALADPLEERGKEGMELFQVPRSYTSVEDLLKNEKADLAVICSPTGFHAQQSIAFLEHGIHVFCDKPAASSLAETCAMFEAAEK
ncbi:MAG: Gfo/Idh/MocA family oxidoreductase, partial [Lentisphaeria bacterium]|nr:Gfo/Idh/MocA family oxidoreductase [Lentisphaeria bacterium]